MKIRLGTLRRLIRESADGIRTQNLIRQAVRSAKDYVDSVMTGSVDSGTVEQLRQDAETIVGYAKHLLNHRDERSEPVALVAKYAQDIAELSDFWKRPAFIGKRSYVEKLQTLLRMMQRNQHAAMA